MEDVWSPECVLLTVTPTPPQRDIDEEVLKEIVMRSVTEYLKRPGHVLVPECIVSEEEFERERENPLLRVKRFWEFWHGKDTLNCKRTRGVSDVLNRFPYFKTKTHSPLTPRSTSTSHGFRTLSQTTQELNPPLGAILL